MPYIGKDPQEILRHALNKLQDSTPITSIGPGSVARSITELVSTELGDFYSLLEYNTAMGVLSTAQGRALDLLGQLYNIERKQLSQIATIDQSLGSFYFYMESPHVADVTIPAGTTVYTDAENFVGEEFSYVTEEEAVIPAGRLRVFTSIRPQFTDSVFTAGKNTLVRHNLDAPEGVEVFCTNPKPIQPQVGYESDDNYRTRIQKEVRRSAGGTSEALRFASLSVPGVRDAIVRSAPYGLGTSEVLVVPEDNAFAASTVSQVITEVQRTRPVGVRVFVRQPEYITAMIRANILVRRETGVNPTGTAQRAEIAIIRFLNRHLPGQQLIYNQLVQSILEASHAIADVTFESFRIDGVEVLRRNFRPEEDQQIIPGEVRVSPSQ